MARSKVVTTNPDLPRQSSLCSLSTLLAEPSKSITMDDLLLKSFYSSSEPIPDPDPNPNPNHNHPQPVTASAPQEIGGSSSSSKTVEDVWKEMVRGATELESHHNNITLEDFLSKAAAVVTDHDVTAIIPPPPHPPSSSLIPNGTTLPPVAGVSEAAARGGGGGRGKRRRAVEEAVVDKATLQKQKRMIKNRESAARSRERKQAYTVELESMVVQLEEENARLLREQADRNKQRYKQLMECLIPVVDERKPRRMLRRVNSVQW